MNWKVLALAFILLIAIPSVLAASNPKQIDRWTGEPIIKERIVVTHNKVIPAVKTILTTEHTTDKTDDIFKSIGQFLTLIPKDVEQDVFTVDDKMVGILPTDSKFTGITGTDVCLRLHQFGTDRWFTCELSPKPVVTPTLTIVPTVKPTIEPTLKEEPTIDPKEEPTMVELIEEEPTVEAGRP